jgi:ribosomal protein L40E
MLLKERLMYQSDETTTVSIKPCRRCGAGLIAESKFCRTCGAAQSSSSLSGSQPAISSDDGEREQLQHFSTTRLSQQKLYHPVSGPLVSAVAEGVPINAPRSPATGLSKRMLLALMAIPIWVMIILLSPLDAYASAKIIGSRI